MPIKKQILNHLEKNNTRYEIIAHRKVYTAFDASQTLKVHPQEIAKSLILQIKKDFYIVILGANKNLDFSKIAKKFKIAQKDIKIPSEKILINKFKIKPGSAHVFGSIYKIPTIIDKSFSTLKTAIFSSGSFKESFKIKLKDYLKLEESEVFAFGKAKKLKIQKAKPKKKQKKSKGKKAALKKKKLAPKKKVIKRKTKK
jgi:prolyl-tRNA editing enzyme YbaK/EbsC (Cys-tRNA(Pro) deacylase)